jgi:molecular chaperone GrpE (heat shock protein)
VRSGQIRSISRHVGNTEQAQTEQPEEKRRSPAEAFDDLKATVNRSAAEIAQLWEFSQKVKDKLFKTAELHRLEGMLPVLDSLLQIHGSLFLRVKASGTQADDDKKSKKDKKKDKDKETPKEAATDDAFIASLLETLEEELTRHGVEVFNPAPGSAFDVRLMDCTQPVERGSRKDKANTVAAVNRCGFLYKMPSEKLPRIVAKAQVEVFAK